MALCAAPKAGVFVVRAAPVLFHNLRAALTTVPAALQTTGKGLPKAYPLGEKSALAEKFGLGLSGRCFGRWKRPHRIALL